MAVNQRGVVFGLQRKQPGGGQGGGGGIIGVGEPLGGFGLAVYGVGGKNYCPGGQSDHQRQVPRCVAGGGDRPQSVAEISFFGDQAIGGVGPCDGADIAPVRRARQAAFCGGQDDRAGKQRQGSDVINVAMRQNKVGDVGGRQTQQRQLPCGGLAGREIDQFAKGRKIIACIGGGVICGIGGIKPGIDQNPRALVGFEQKAGNADGAFAGAHIEGAEIKDVKADDVMGGQRQGRAF